MLRSLVIRKAKRQATKPTGESRPVLKYDPLMFSLATLVSRYCGRLSSIPLDPARSGLVVARDWKSTSSWLSS